MDEMDARRIVAAAHARKHADTKTLSLVTALECEHDEVRSRIGALQRGEAAVTGREVFNRAAVLAFRVAGCLLMVEWAIVVGRAQ